MEYKNQTQNVPCKSRSFSSLLYWFPGVLQRLFLSVFLISIHKYHMFASILFTIKYFIAIDQYLHVELTIQNWLAN